MDYALTLSLICHILPVLALFNFAFRSTVLFKNIPNEIKQLPVERRCLQMRETGFISSFADYVSYTCRVNLCAV